MRALLICALLCACKTAPERLPPQPISTDTALHPRSTISQEEPAYLESLREEYRARGNIQAVLGWYSATQGEPSLTQITYLGHDRLFNRQALEAVDRSLSRPGWSARETGFADYVALSEDLRGVALQPLLLQGVAYLKATDGRYAALLARIAREELGIPREKLRTADMSRLFKAPRLAPYFDKSLGLKALRRFLSGIGLDLGAVQVDDSLHPRKRPRAFVNPVDAPADVRLSVKPVRGLDDYWTLFHEAGHAVHFASATIVPKELVTLGHGAPTEAFGEFFRHAFSDPRWLLRYRAFLAEEEQPRPGNTELNDAESQRYRSDVDDTFYSADYERAFVLAGMMHDGIRRRFGEDWYANKEVGAFLRKELFSEGTALSAEDVAAKLGFPPRVDFDAAAARAARLVADADALEK
jgi:hypothetical protein